jgi:predicted GIY-YIG superfamily endonuclease
VKWYVYILACDNKSFYVGHTRDLSSRFDRHRSGTGAAHTALNAPTAILYHECFSTELEAVQRERQLKRWSRAKKEALIAGDMRRLHHLSKSRDHTEQ